MGALLIKVLEKVGPDIEDVCFKYTRSGADLRRVRHLRDLLQPPLCKFKKFSILLPDGEIGRRGRKMLKRVLRDLRRRYSLEGVFIRLGDDIFSPPESEEHRGSLEEWVRVLDNDGVPLGI